MAEGRNGQRRRSEAIRCGIENGGTQLQLVANPSQWFRRAARPTHVPPFNGPQDPACLACELGRAWQGAELCPSLRLWGVEASSQSRAEGGSVSMQRFGLGVRSGAIIHARDRGTGSLE